MKFSDRMRYPHPVLSEFSADYVTGEFRCTFEQQMTLEGELKIVADLVLDSRDLQRLVADQRAAVGYFLVCRRTYFNFLQRAPLGKSEKFFDVSKLYGTVVVRSAVWTLDAVENFTSPLINKEFGGAVSLPKGAVIALGPEFRFSVDKKKFKPFESIFELAENPSVTPGTVLVDSTLDRITILSEPKTHKAIANMRNLNAGKDLLLTAVYMPAIMDVLANLQNGDSGMAGRKWYRVFKAKCDEMGIDPANPNQSTLVVAQMLLREPLKKTIAVAETI